MRSTGSQRASTSGATTGRVLSSSKMFSAGVIGLNWSTRRLWIEKAATET